MNHRTRFAAAAILSTLLGGLGSARAADPVLSFSVTLDRPNSASEFYVTVRNTSRGFAITGVELSVGHEGYSYDEVDNFSGTGSATGVLNIPNDGGANEGTKSKRVAYTLSSLDPGDQISFQIDIDDNDRDFRSILFNNGDEPNAVVSVTAAGGEVLNITLPDGPGNNASYTFVAGPQPRFLKVKSVVEAAVDSGGGIDPVFVSEAVIRVNGDLVTDQNLLAPPGTVSSQDIGSEITVSVFEGDTVEITAPQVAYRKLNGDKLTDSVLGDPAEIQTQAEERFTAIGISVNDVPQTGDPTLYRFDIEEDTVAVVKWRHDYALRIESDFSDTESPPPLNPDGSPWAGPLVSQANGNPEPAAGQLHWIEKGTQVVTQIDGQYVDQFVHPGLDVRFVPYAYIAYGPPNSQTTAIEDEARTNLTNDANDAADRKIGDEIVNARGMNPNGEFANPDDAATLLRQLFTLPAGQSPEPRQQVESFTMYGPSEIRYLWKIQYGIRVNVTGSGEPKIFAPGGTDRTGEGVFWFDPGEEVTVASPAAESAATDAQSLTGWLSGDGYYFGSRGEIDAASGALESGFPVEINNIAVANWQPIVPGNSSYRGLRISSLDRPAKVLWTYGTGAIRVTATVGEYVFQGNPALAELFSNEPAVKQVPPPTNSDAAEQAVWDPVAKKYYPLVESKFSVDWIPQDGSDPVEVIIDAKWPDRAHYPHVAGTPAVALDPDPDDTFIFKELKYSENSAVIDEDKQFTANTSGKSTLLFSEIQRVGRGQPREFLRVRVVETQTLAASLLDPGSPREVVIGSRITDPQLDLARLDTGYLVNSDNDETPSRARYNPFIYDPAILVGLASRDIYDTEQLFSNSGLKVVVNRAGLPGPIIPVNLDSKDPNADENDLIRVIWYDDPTRNDGLLWPHQGRVYQPRWPEPASLDRRELAEVADGDADPEGRTFNFLANASDIALDGNIAYVTSASEDALTIIDINDVLNFRRLAQLSPANGLPGLDRAAAVAVSDGRALVAGSLSGTVTILDVSNPVIPFTLATIENGVGDFMLLSNPEALAVEGDLAFVASGGLDSAVSLIDISTPTEPRLVSVLKDGTDGFDELRFVSGMLVRGNILYIISDGDGALTIVNISDPNNPELISTLDGLDGADAIAIAGDHAYVARGFGAAGVLSVVDISDAEQPVLTGEVVMDTAGTVQDVAVTGEFAIVPTTTALSVVNIGDPTAPHLVEDIGVEATTVAVSNSFTLVTGDNKVRAFDIRGEHLGRIVIATQWGSESEDAAGRDQLVAPAIGDVPRTTTFDPSRLQQVQIYNQPARSEPGYNPNEEHALMAPSLRNAQVSPRPPAAYALRDDDLNVFPGSRFASNDRGGADYTSEPYVLVQYFDTADEEFKMKVYDVQKEDMNATGPEFGAFYQFSSIPNSPTPALLAREPFVRMEAGEPVIPFYPLGVVDGAVPCPNTYGTDILAQKTYWEDHRGSNWAISGGNDAWFRVSPYYRIDPNFWWPRHSDGIPKSGRVVEERSVVEARYAGNAPLSFLGVNTTVPVNVDIKFDVIRHKTARVGAADCVAFLPKDVTTFLALPENTEVQRLAKPQVDSVEALVSLGFLGSYRVSVPIPADAGGGFAAKVVAVDLNLPSDILYKSDWPTVVPVLKAGETLTFSGGEFRADHPTMVVSDANGERQTIDTPGLPAVLAFATAEVVYDSLNPTGMAAGWKNNWTARVAQVLDVRRVPLSTEFFPAALQPANGKSRVSGGKFVFVDLPASLQKRVRYNPLSQFKDDNDVTRTGMLEISGLLNDKDIGDATLTAAPPAVYVLEPNILTQADVDALMALDGGGDDTPWDVAVKLLFKKTRNPNGLTTSANPFWLGLEGEVKRNSITGEAMRVPIEPGSQVTIPQKNPGIAAPVRAFGPGLALLPNGEFLNPSGLMPGSTEPYPEVSYVTVMENNDPSLGGSPITPHVIKVDRRDRYRGSIKTVESDNVFDENLVLRHTGDFAANTQELFFEWWYRPDDGSLNVPPPDLIPASQTNPWKLFPDPSGKRGRGLAEVTLKGNPNAPEALIADTFWFVRYRHQNDMVDGTDWGITRPDGTGDTVYTWAGAGNSQPFEDFDGNGIKDFRAQLASGWIKRVLDAVNPYEARIREFDGDNPATVTSMLQQFGPRFEGPVALNPDKNVIENVGLIELYETILKRGRDLTIDLSRPVSTPAIANALQLASTRISDFYNLLGNEAYTDALDHTIGFGSDSVEYGSLAPTVHAFQNQVSSLMEEELGLLRGVDEFYARPVYNRLFWNFVKGEGEAAYALNYNITDINQDGFINEDDAMILYPQGHGDAWGHYLTALRNQYELLRHPFFNWVSRSEFYNLQDIVIKVDFLDERKFAQTAAAKAKAGSEVVDLTYRDRYVADPTAQWQGYTDSNPDRAAGVQGWARRAGQGAYFDWVVANAVLPSSHPNEDLEGIQKVDRSTNSDIAVISANLNRIQRSFDEANDGYNPLGLAENAVPFDLDPQALDGNASTSQGVTHFEQIYRRAVSALKNASATWDNANQTRNMLRKIGNSEREFRNKTFQQDITYRNRLIKIFGKPYEGTIGPGQLYPAGYEGPDLALYMYVNVREINRDTVPGPTTDFASFSASGDLDDGDLFDALQNTSSGHGIHDNDLADLLGADYATTFNPTFEDASNYTYGENTDAGLFAVNYTDLTAPKVGLENFVETMPVTAAGYTFQAPNAWGSRGATGELQLMINKMIQQEARIVQSIGKWDGLQGAIVREMRIISARIDTASEIRLRNEIFQGVKFAVNSVITILETAKNVSEIVGETTYEFALAGQNGIPFNLPTAGLAVSPGDALSLARAGVAVSGIIPKTASATAAKAFEIGKLIAELAFGAAELGVDFANQTSEGQLARREWLQGLEDMIGDEPVIRIEIFQQIQALRELSDRYRALLDEGTRLIDERQAFNKRVAAQTQRGRYQDMTFRVSRNHALQTYHDSREIAARYAYLAAKAYDYETNYAPGDPGSPQEIFNKIIKARGLGHLSGGQPQFGKGGIAEALAWLKTNYDSQKGQLGFNNPQTETGKMSLRTEMLRILPRPATPPGGVAPPPTVGDAAWAEALQNARVDDLWEVPEFRYHCRPFASEQDAAGTHAPQPGLVLRFGTQVIAGENFFGKPLSGGDQAFDPSNFSTKVRSAGIWFSDYQSEDLDDLAQAPRVYLVPVGTDIMNIPTAGVSPEADDERYQRLWNVVDQSIPVPLPAQNADLDNGSWVPLLDSLNGRLGEPRRFSSFRAYHDGSSAINEDELVFDSRLIGRSVWNTEWVLIVPGLSLNANPEVGLQRFIQQVSDIKLIFQTYGFSGG